MDALERDWIHAFLDFLNDPKAEARTTEARFAKHPYVRERLDLFKSTDQPDFKPLQKDMREKLLAVIESMSEEVRTEIIEALNRLQFDGSLAVGSREGQPFLKPVKIGALVEYQLKSRSIVIKNYPTISGVENACWYALALISKDEWRYRIKMCPVKIKKRECGKFFNTLIGQKYYCCKAHAEKAEAANATVRVWNLRHPDDKRPLPYA